MVKSRARGIMMQYLRLHSILEDVLDCETIEFERLHFNGGENHIKLLSPIKGRVTIEAKLINSDYVMELLLATDALKRAGAQEIYLLAPYIPYGRQDRVMVPGEPLSIKVFANLINAQNYKAVYTLDNHSEVTTALIDRCVEINNHRIIARFILQGLEDVLFISPDAGSYKKISKLGVKYGREVVQASKIRDVRTGVITGTRVYADDLGGRTCLIIDDICDGGRTFIELARVLKEKNAGRIILYVSHGIFSHGVDSFTDIDSIVTTNCFRRDSEIANWNLRVISLRKEDLK